jgi:hypothetical protein
MAQSPANNSGCLIPFGGLFALAGLVLLVAVGRQTDPAQIPSQLYLALTFTATGAGLLIYGVSAGQVASKSKALMSQNPDKPWLWRDDWAQGFARPEWRSSATAIGAMGLLVLLVSLPSLLAIPKNWHTGHRYQMLFVLPLPLAGLYVVGQSSLAFLRERKFRQTRFVLSTTPGVMGGRLAGQLESAYILPPGTQVKETLSCVRSYEDGTGGGSH